MIFEKLIQFGSLTNTRGEEQTLANLQFKYLGLYFTADWCGSCVKKAPQLLRALEDVEEHHPNILKIITFRLDQTISKFGHYFWKFQAINYEQASELSHMLGVKFIPAMIIFNRSGRLITMRGYDDLLRLRQNAIPEWDKKQ